MSSMGAHPEDGLLLRYIDGELPARKIRQVARHLEACWQCRTEIEDLQRVVADCVRYRKNVLAAHLPPPPNPWPDLDRDFARLDASIAGEAWVAGLGGWLRAPALRPWAITAAAALVLGCALFFELRQTPSVQAAALLNRAVSVAAQQPQADRSIQIRTKTGKFTRRIGRRPVSKPAPESASLETRFEAARYDWQDPLSARAYRDWRNGLPSKSDEVSTVPDPSSPFDNFYQIRTATADGDLAVASMRLRTTDLRPVEARLEFRDREWVELTDITDASTGEGAPPALTRVEPPAPRVVPSLPAASSSGTASISEELQVLAALHEVGADLGDPVEVQRSEGKILVSGVGVPRAREAQIRSALEGKPGVIVRFSEPAIPAVPAEPDSTVSPGAAPRQSEPRIEKQFGGHAEFERFSSQVLDGNEALMARAYALRALAQRFPVSREAGLNAQDRQVLRGIVRDHAASLGREEANMQRLIQPVLASMGATAPLPKAPAGAGADWQGSAEDLLRASHRVEVLLSRILGASEDGGNPARLPSDLLSAMGELRADLGQFQRVLGK